ncbi:MAG: helix-turn-helix domain-containing protein [Fimbriiglobus sp.]
MESLVENESQVGTIMENVKTEKAKRLTAQTYTVAEVAELLGVSERHIHRLRDQKRIPGEMRIGNCVRFAKQIIDRWVSGGQV